MTSLTTRPPTRAGVFRFSAAQFLVALVLLLVVTPFLEQFRDGDLVEAVLLTLVLSTAVLAVAKRRRTLVIAAVVASPSILFKWVSHFRPDLVRPEVFLVTGLVFVAWVAGSLLLYILRAPLVDSEVLCAGIAGYLTLGVLWTFAYLAVARAMPGSFATGSGPASMDRFTAVYFSFVTLTTTGYGDIAPVANLSRLLAILEAITGTFYVAVVISRLVALYSTSGAAVAAPAPSPGPNEPSGADPKPIDPAPPPK
jgi:voltage-gated potassium channel